MTNKEYKKIRGEYRPIVRAAFLEWKLCDENEFVITEKSLALFNEAWDRLRRAARALKCTEKQAADMLIKRK